MEEKKKKEENQKFQWVRELIPYVLILLVVIFIKSYVVAPVVVKGESMTNTLQEKDVMLLNKLSYKLHDIKRFDIVVISKEDTYLIKRIIGLPGDTILIQDNQLYINDEKVEEPYLTKGTITADFSLFQIEESGRIPNDCYFVLGDHREVSKDSRSFGLVKKEEIVGKATFTVFPFSRFGTKN